MNGVPQLNEIPETVNMILAFLADIEGSKKVVGVIQAANKNNTRIDIRGGNTKQGRYALQIEGAMPKGLAVTILGAIDELGGDIEVLAGS